MSVLINVLFFVKKNVQFSLIRMPKQNSEYTMKKLIIFAIVSLLFSLSDYTALAQKRGKPPLDRYTGAKKRAKGGDVKAMVKLGDVCKGGMYTSGAYKDYKKALSWYKEANSTPGAKPGERGELGVFQIYFFGGYGVERNMDTARKWYFNAVRHRSSIQRYDYREDLPLGDFFKHYKAAKGGAVHSQLMTGRYFLELAISFKEGKKWLEKAVVQGDKDALYLLSKWELLRKERKTFEKHPDDADLHKKLLVVMKQGIEEGSQMAKLDYVHEKVLFAADGKPAFKDGEAYELLKAPLESEKFADRGMRLKAYILLSEAQNGRPKLKTYRKIAEMSKRYNTSEYPHAQPTFSQAKTVCSLMTSLEGVSKVLERYKEINDFELDIDGYRNAFEGDVTKMLNIYASLEKEKNIELLGAENTVRLKEELIGSIPKILNQIDDPIKAIETQRAFKNKKVLQQVYYKYKPFLDQKFKDLDIDGDNLEYYRLRQRIELKRFKKLSDGRGYLSMVNNDKDIKPETRAQLKSYLKKHIIREVLGKAPEKRDIDRVNDELYKPINQWLLPEAESEIFRYKSDSPNWFSKKIRRGNVTYFYELVRKNIGQYDLIIKKVENNKSNLAFKSTVEFSEPDPNTIRVKVFRASQSGYQWKVNRSAFLGADYPRNEDQIRYNPVGIDYFKDSKHNHSKKKLLSKAIPQDFSLKTAIRSAVEYMIIEYNGLVR